MFSVQQTLDRNCDRFNLRVVCFYESGMSSSFIIFERPAKRHFYYCGLFEKCADLRLVVINYKYYKQINIVFIFEQYNIFQQGIIVMLL